MGAACYAMFSFEQKGTTEIIKIETNYYNLV